MTDILFGQAYFLRFDPKLWREMKPYPPLGPLYAAAVLRQAGHDVGFFDSMLAAGEDEWHRRVASERPRFAVLFEDNFNYLTKMCLNRMREAALAMTAAAREAGATVIVCGSDSTDNAERYLRAGAEYVLLGEGEETLRELVGGLSGGEDFDPSGVAGLAFAGGDGGVTETPRRKPLRDLDALPFPARDLIDAGRYRDAWRARHGHYSVNMVTTRGCPYHCNWCAKPIWGQIYNSRSPENVVSEMAQLKETLAPDHIWFADDIMGLKPAWLSRFADQVEAHAVKTPFKCLSRADLLLRGDDAASLARAGCQTVWIGAESGSQKILDAMEKGTTVEQIREARQRLGQAHVRVGYFIQYGYPGETRADIAATLALVRETLPDELGISVSYPLPGTKFFSAVEADLGAKRNWQDSDDMAMLYRGPFTTAFYRQLHGLTHHMLRAARHRAALRQPGKLRARRLAAYAYHAALLVLARLRLAILAALPHRGGAAAAAELSRDAAGRPSPQA